MSSTEHHYEKIELKKLLPQIRQADAIILDEEYVDFSRCYWTQEEFLHFYDDEEWCVFKKSDNPNPEYNYAGKIKLKDKTGQTRLITLLKIQPIKA